MTEKNKTAGGATGGWAETRPVEQQGHLNYTTPAPALSSPPADPLVTYHLARYVAGATDADLDMIRRTFPDAPLDSRDNLRTWLETQPDLLCAVLAADPAAPPRPAHETTLAGDIELHKDYGHASVLSGLFRDRYRWATRFGTWMHYDGRVWRAVPQEAVAKAAADALRQHYAERLAAAHDKATIQDLSKKVAETCVYDRIRGALNFLKGWPGILTMPEAWDQDPYLLNCANGTLNLKTYELQPHNPADLLTMMADAPYDPQAPGDKWRAHLEKVLPDPEVRRQVQRDLGLSLVGTTQTEVLPIWYGTGANGKSTTLRVLMAVIGTYAQMAAPRLLLASKYERHPTELAELRGKRLVFSVEISQDSRLDEERVKQLTGGERIRARFMRQDNIEFERTWTICLVTNHKPVIQGTDNAIWRRVRLVPWTVTLPEEEQRPQDQMVADLLTESGAILAWLVEGLRDYERDNHWLASGVQEATEIYRAEQDVLGGFLADHCELGPRFTAPVGELYEKYLEWCAQSGEDALSKRSFGKRLRERGIIQKRAPGGKMRLWVGIRICDTM